MDFQGGLEDDRVPDHPTNCENLARIFYLVKLPEFQNPKLVAAEQHLRRQRMILKSRRKKSQVYKDRLRLSPYCSSYYDQGWKRVMEDLKALHVSLDKITFENNKCLIKPVGPNTPPEEIDNLGLRFGMLHGSNNLANERKILKKTRLKQRKNSLTTLPDYDCRIKELQSSLGNVRHGSAMEKQRILMEITELKLAREAAIQTAVCKGEMWESLGDKDGIQKKIKIMQEDIKASKAQDLVIKPKSARQFEAAGKDLARLDKQMLHTEGIIGLAFKSFRRWTKEDLLANTCYNQYTSFSNDARELAEKKDVASLRSLCEQQV
ncbi:hypothetical protein MLD38_030555 [Melastoma candidum]|uniref:Uncharacterized protein n=1 Tax=Melastoma candidum TaxID=119954 RepID=A0ACB9MLZ3_9MYRT|nr:hypothetical protein MLD38_030555 [Melastoma candidum]